MRRLQALKHFLMIVISCNRILLHRSRLKKKHSVKNLWSLEADVQKKLAFFTKQIRTDISEAQSKKDNMKNYVNPYSNVARDGTFYDTKQ